MSIAIDVPAWVERSVTRALRSGGIGRAELRDFIQANMFDGHDTGEITTRVDRLLDDLCDVLLYQQDGKEIT